MCIVSLNDTATFQFGQQILKIAWPLYTSMNNFNYIMLFLKDSDCPFGIFKLFLVIYILT